MKFIFYFLFFISMTLTNHRPAISGKDVIVNNINNSYSQKEINQIANIIVIKDGKDITHLLTMTEDNYFNNENKKGVYYQTYQVIDFEQTNDGLEEVVYQYILTIYNVDLSENKKELLLKTTPDAYLFRTDLIKEIEENLNIELFNLEIINTNYLNNQIEGTFFIEVLATTSKNEKININITIDSYYEEKENIPTKVLVLAGAGTVTTLTVVVSVIRRRRKI